MRVGRLKTLARCSLFAALVVAVGLTVFTGCGRQGDQGQSETIRVGYTPIVECLPLFVALELGFFEEAGVRVQTTQFPGDAPTLEAVGAGSIDIGLSNLVSLIFAKAGGRDFVAVWGATIEDKEHTLRQLVVLADSPVRQLADLRGKSIAVNTLKNIDQLLVTKSLAKHGVEADEVRFLEVPFPRMPAVLANGDVDAIAVVEPFLSCSTDEGRGRVVSHYFVEADEQVWVTSYCASRAWVSRNEVALSRFRSAMDSATKYYQENEQNERYAREIMRRHARLSMELAGKMTLPVFSENLPEARGIDSLVGDMSRRGWIDRSIASEEVLYGHGDRRP